MSTARPVIAILTLVAFAALTGGGANGAETRSAEAEGGAAERARPGPSRLWYKLFVDYQGRPTAASSS